MTVLYYGWIGTRISKRAEKQDREDHEWQLKHEGVAVQLARIHLTTQVQRRGDNYLIMLYPTLFPDPQLAPGGFALNSWNGIR